jgi:hypothetical protein
MTEATLFLSGLSPVGGKTIIFAPLVGKAYASEHAGLAIYLSIVG